MRRIDKESSLEAVKDYPWVVCQCVYNVETQYRKTWWGWNLWCNCGAEHWGGLVGEGAQCTWTSQEQVAGWARTSTGSDHNLTSPLFQDKGNNCWHNSRGRTTASLKSKEKKWKRAASRNQKKNRRVICWPHVTAGGSDGHYVSSHEWLMYAELDSERLDLNPPWRALEWPWSWWTREQEGLCVGLFSLSQAHFWAASAEFGGGNFMKVIRI